MTFTVLGNELQVLLELSFRISRLPQDGGPSPSLRRACSLIVLACKNSDSIMSSAISNIRPSPDSLLVEIAAYAADYFPSSAEAIDTARYCFMDTLGCGLLALRYPECTKTLGPVVPGAFLPNGARIPGTAWQLDPVHAAFNIGAMIRWLDFNDTWLAAEWGHPSDNLGGILALADYLNSLRSTVVHCRRCADGDD